MQPTGLLLTCFQLKMLHTCWTVEHINTAVPLPARYPPFWRPAGNLGVDPSGLKRQLQRGLHGSSASSSRVPGQLLPTLNSSTGTHGHPAFLGGPSSITLFGQCCARQRPLRNRSSKKSPDGVTRIPAQSSQVSWGLPSECIPLPHPQQELAALPGSGVKWGES